ncbi:hypothetical protein ACG98H_02175 [Corynebacterium sp. L4756]|uniref:hypothetical protein n=1 Tax=unclassified Corynebacterium TaxID=2624378 RepID=UPI00374C9C8C
MLVAALVLALVAFIAFVNYILSAATWSLILVFLAAGAGIILFIIDWYQKSKAKPEPNEDE